MQEGGLAKRLNVFIFAIPAFCDCCASTLMFVALVLTTASIY
jgi:hypothetical protein